MEDLLNDPVFAKYLVYGGFSFVLSFGIAAYIGRSSKASKPARYLFLSAGALLIGVIATNLNAPIGTPIIGGSIMGYWLRHL